MTVVEIICVALLSVFILLFIADFICEYLCAKRETERDKKIDHILYYVENEMNDSVFPEFKDGKK